MSDKRWHVAAAILTLLALFFGAMGVLALNEIVVRGHVLGGSGGVAEVFVGLGVGLLLVAAVHVVAAALLWRRRSVKWAAGLARVGVVVGTVTLALAVFGARDVSLVVLLFPLAYGIVLVCVRDERPRNLMSP